MTGAFVPTPEWLTLEWHHATLAAGSLCVQRCGSCGRWRHPPRRRCPGCFSDLATFELVTGFGAVLSYAVSHRSLDPEWQELVPFVTLVVELDEGPRVVAATELDRSEVVLGLRVALEVQRSSDDVAQLWARLGAPLQQ
jgi:uncharacterized OB-fold protein